MRLLIVNQAKRWGGGWGRAPRIVNGNLFAKEEK